MALLLIPLHGRADTASDIRDLTGAPTRIVWIQDAGNTACIYSEKPTIRVMGFDTEDGKGERPILPDIGWYAKPLLTADGKRVVFANLTDHSVDVVNFDGTGRRQVLKNDEAYKHDAQAWENDSLWTDPKSGVIWVYAEDVEQRAGQEVTTIRRYQLDNPKVSELIWDKTPVHMFMVSGDGRAASGGIGDGGNTPQGMFTLPNGTFYARAGGCWPSMSPDASHRMWVFTGNHRSIHFCVPTNRTGSAAIYPVRFEAPGLTIKNNEEMYHPRWTNNVHFASLDSPFSHVSWISDSKIPMDVAANVEIYIGKFTDDFKGIQKWVQVTHNTVGDYWSNVWIMPSKEAQVSLATAPELPEEKPSAPPDNKGLIYVWQTGGDGNQLSDPATGTLHQCSGQFRGNARYVQFFVMDLTDGAFVPDGAADWLLPACKLTNQFALETVVTPTGPASTADGIVMAFADDPANGNFVLSQKGDALGLRLKTDGSGATPQTIPLCNLVRDRPNHLIVSYADGRLGFYLNGQRIALPETLHGRLSGWTAQSMIFGDAWKGGQNWTGLMEDIGLFNREINATEARERYLQYRARTNSRKPAQTVIMDAKLIGSCPAADPKGIAPYRRCLSVQLYEVSKVISGTCNDPKISVAQWSVLDGQVVPSYAKMAVGQTYRLALEKMDDHPEQESERTISGDFDANSTQLYYEIRTPDATPSAAATPAASDAANVVATDDISVVVDPKPDDLTFNGTVQMAGHGQIAAVTVVNGGFGYSEAPQVHFSGGGGQGATATAFMTLSSLDVTKVGSDYTSEPTVTISAPDLAGGRQATAKARIDKAGGTISGISINDAGSGYVKQPQVTMSNGDGTGAEAEATMSVSGITVTNSGSGYTTPPAITFDGVDGQDAAGHAALQVKIFRFSDASGNGIFTNSGTLGQSASALVFDWAAPANNSGKANFNNKGTWTLQNGARVQFISSTGHVDRTGDACSSSGTLSVLDHSLLGFSKLENSGTLELGAGVVLGQSDYAMIPNVLANHGKGAFKIVGSTPDEPATFGYIGSESTGARTIENGSADGSSQAQMTIGNGKDASTLTVIGGQANLTNFAGSILEINPGAMLALITNDNGSPHPFIGRDAKVTNTGEFVLAGQLRVQGNHGGFTGIENSGKLTIHGDQAKLDRLPNSGPGGFYDLDKNPSQILNKPGGRIQGIGDLTYMNSTGNQEGRAFKLINLGTITPGEPAVGQAQETFGVLTLNSVNVVFGAAAPPLKTPRPVVPAPPPIPATPPIPGILQIGIGGPASSSDHFDSLVLSGADNCGKLVLIKDEGNLLNIVPSAGFTPHGTYRIVTAVSVVGTFDALQYNGVAQAPYTVNYLPNGIEVVFP